VEDVEEVGLLPPAQHFHDYARVEQMLATWHEEEDNRLGDLPAGLSNSGNTCFAASALQCLYHTRLFTAHFSDEPHGECSVRGFCVTCEYQSHVRRALDSTPQSSFSIGKLTNAINKIAKHFVRGRQEDSHEYIRGLLDGIHVQCLKEIGGEKAEKVFDARTQETTMVYHIFGGYTCGRVVCGDCGHESRNYQPMIDIPVDVSPRGVPSVESSMKSNFVDTETLDGSNKYKCGRCHAYVRAEKGAKIHVSPNVLILPLKRFQVGRFSKITKHVEFPIELDLTPYMSPDAPYEGEGPPLYQLYGVVVHLDWMGSAHSGHYISYVRLADGRWCKCDDGRVEECDEATVLKQKAYLLFYERETVRAAPPVRTQEQQARVEELGRLTAERTERVKARRAAAEAARKAARAGGKSPKGKAPAAADMEEEEEEEEEVDQTLTVPAHTFSFVGKQSAAAPRRRAASSSSDTPDSDTSEDEAAAEDEEEGDEDDDAVDLPKMPWRGCTSCEYR
jgi:ubiquitin carboxyl-terminal hydrolase 36/42